MGKVDIIDEEGGRAVRLAMGIGIPRPCSCDSTRHRAGYGVVLHRPEAHNLCTLQLAGRRISQD